ncbi:N-terminal domain of peptidoglycan hydrolase CwlO-containing protein [Evansella caseinilytica]|uniref:N-terminal domain of peptidoglycan hydrolase CwlO-containing protein n=1 Tax=Evansella caseinilytica TaxID=1503961 RepID=A0A1H3S9J4_9BACI|nr:M23 family metallopeptidase [Evansella caseinilytica]SDZ34235.1 N-terminal domain of peptidoglycan hydrolase CwlO-containing protein [Evansella caseinilytica]
MYRRPLLASLAFILATATLLGATSISFVEANTGEELKDEIDSLKKQQDKLDEESKNTEDELKKVEEEIDKVVSEVRKLDQEMYETNEKINDKQEEIDTTTDRIEELRENIVELEDRIAQRDELLKERARSMYKTGGVINYLEVVLGAQNFGDLVERVTALNTIAQQDRNILEQHIADKNALEAAKLELEEELAKLEQQMSELEELYAEFEKKREQQDELMGQLEEQQVSLEDFMLSIEEEQELLKAQEKAAEAELQRWEEEQKRLEEERKKAEEERKRQEEEEAKKNQQQVSRSNSGSSSSSSSSSSTSSGSASAPSDTGGVFMRPASGAITSGYGMRWGRMHNGIDIGAGGRTNVPIVAADSGTVISAGWMNGYGNTILISHVVNGQSVTTLYGHLNEMHVSAGQQVSRGQQIGIMGNTGNVVPSPTPSNPNAGTHLHFEVHPGGWGSGNAVDPMKYMN